MTNPNLEEDEVVLRVLHTADWHLGRRFRSFPEEDARKLTRARLEVLDSIFGLAERRSVDAVLCAGDLFDDPFPVREWWEPLTDMLGKLAWTNRPVFMLPGNHDPLVAESVWSSGHAFRRALPDWVHVVDRDDFTYSFGEKAVLYAVPCMSKAGQRDPSDVIPCREAGDDRIRIGMMHGSTFDMEEHQTNFPSGRTARCAGASTTWRSATRTASATCPRPAECRPPSTRERRRRRRSTRRSRERRRRALHQAARGQGGPRARRRLDLGRGHCTQPRRAQALRDRRDLAKRVLQLHLEMRLAPKEYEHAEALLRELEGTSAKVGRAGILVLDRAKMELDTTDMAALVAGWPEVLVRTANLIKADRDADPRVAQQALYKLYELSRRP